MPRTALKIQSGQSDSESLHSVVITDKNLKEAINNYFKNPLRVSLIGSERLMGLKLSLILHKYYFGPDHPMKIRFFNAIFKALHMPRFVVPYASKKIISLDLVDLPQRIALEEGYYEKELWNILQPYISNNDVFWDIGSHVGLFTLLGYSDSRIIQVEAFEPNPHLNYVLKLNLALNGIFKSPHKFALYNKKGYAPLHLAPEANQGLSTLMTYSPSFNSSKTVRIETTTIDALIQEQLCMPPSIIKMDVEGAEFNVLEGALNLLKHRPPKAIVFEAECNQSGELLNQNIQSFFNSLQMTVKHIKRPSQEIEERENFLATPNHP